MNRYLNSIISSRGEGIILRKPCSLYEHGKSQFLLKIKVFISCVLVMLCCYLRIVILCVVCTCVLILSEGNVRRRGSCYRY